MFKHFQSQDGAARTCSFVQNHFQIWHDASSFLSLPSSHTCSFLALKSILSVVRLLNAATTVIEEMGINGLLKGLQSFSKKCHITEFENQSLAVDASSWLHKSVYSIAEKHVEAAERSTTNHDPSCINTSAQYMISRCTELLDHGAKISGIYLVMDGKRCPLKAQTNDEREQRRISNLKDARLYKKERKIEKSQDKYKACIKIHAAFADAVAQQIQSHFIRNHDDRVHILKSPYEADSQLVKLCVDGAVQAIVTEDSDVLVYCAACHVSVPILYKLERHGKMLDHAMSFPWTGSSIHN
jgi:exonuclease 1